MPTRLERFLETIDPARILDPVDRDVDHAVTTFPYSRATVTTFDEFEQLLAQFYHHVQHHALHLRAPVPLHVSMYFSQALRMLEKEYGSTARTTAFEIARTGQEGGLYSVLKAVAKGMAQEYVTNGIGSMVSSYLSSLSVAERLADSEEYIEKYAHIIPAEMREGGAPRLRGYFHKVLESHPFLLRGTRRVGW